MVTKEQLLDALADTRRPTIRAVLDSDRPASHTDSKFGGSFYLPAGAAYDGMELLAQINFAQAPPLKGFPRTGILQFFLSTDEATGDSICDESAWKSDAGIFRVVYYPEILDGQPPQEESVPEKRWLRKKITGAMRLEPAEEIATVTIGELDFTADLGFETAAARVSELFQAAFEEEEACDDDDDGDDDDGIEEEGYDLTLCSDTDQFCADFGNWGCKLGGHPSLRYGDVRTEDAAYRPYSTLLFQFDWTASERADPFFLESDTLCFFIKPEDLAACRFDDILLFHHNCF